MASHDEVWDDSALLTSWDEAAAEYKKYHSLAAKGEEVNIGDIVAEPEPEPKSVPETHTAKLKRRKLEKQVANGSGAEQALSGEAPVPSAATPVATGASGTAAVPQALLSSVQDEGLKNLMMSWYYAGYYTGLYEGKQQAQHG